MGRSGCHPPRWRALADVRMNKSVKATSGAPPHDGSIRRGDIFWLAPDAARGSVPGVAHPHVVVQEDVFNQSRIGTVIVCALTSNLHKTSEPGNVLLELGEGGLERQSVIVCSQISSVAKQDLGAYIGSVSQERVDQTIAGLRFVQRAYQGRHRDRA